MLNPLLILEGSDFANDAASGRSRQLARSQRPGNAESRSIELASCMSSSDRERGREIHPRGDQIVEAANLFMIAAEKLQKSRLRSSRAFHAAKRHRRAPILDVAKIQHEVLHPQRGAFTDGRELGGLQVRVAERRHPRIMSECCKSRILRLPAHSGPGRGASV